MKPIQDAYELGGVRTSSRKETASVSNFTTRLSHGGGGGNNNVSIGAHNGAAIGNSDTHWYVKMN